MSTIKLHRHVCAFIDVLGGAKLFKGQDRTRAESFFDLLREFERRFNRWTSSFPKKRQSAYLVKTFSDNIFVAFPLGSGSKASDEEIVGLFLNELVQQIQQMVRFGNFPVRGGVSVGSLMFTDQFVFGPALVEAVELEKSASFPRVLLSKAVLRYIKSNNPRSHLILRDADGLPFLDYLGGYADDIEWHQAYVQEGLAKYANDIRVRQKYEWLASYHNYCALRNNRHDLAILPGHLNSFSIAQS